MSTAEQEPLSPEPTPPPTPNQPAGGVDEKSKQSTEYLVLSKKDDGGNGLWTPLGVYAASSAKAAVSAYVKATEPKSGTYVAVPNRSWVPVTLSVETQTKIKLT